MPQPPTTPEDPALRWEPIAGVSLESYARVSATLFARGDASPSAIANWVTAEGVSPAAWTQARAGWRTRIRLHADVRECYAESYHRQRVRELPASH
jgi:hypothetical protein